VFCSIAGFCYFASNAEVSDEAIVAFEDGFCRGEDKKEFASIAEMEAYEDEHDIRYRSYYYVSEPDKCIEVIVSIGRKKPQLPFIPTTPIGEPPRPPPEDRGSAGNPAEETEFYLETYNTCWKARAELKIADYENTEYLIEVENVSGTNGDPYLLGQTFNDRELIQIYDLNSIFVAGDLSETHGVNVNRWHLIMQTVMHEWIHSEQGAVTRATSYLLVDNEAEAQKKAYFRYKIIYGHEPPYSYYTDEEVKRIKGPEWENKVSRLKELMAKGRLSNDELSEANELVDFFIETKNKLGGKFNEGLYSGTHVDFCPVED